MKVFIYIYIEKRHRYVSVDIIYSRFFSEKGDGKTAKVCAASFVEGYARGGAELVARHDRQPVGLRSESRRWERGIMQSSHFFGNFYFISRVHAAM